MKKILFIIAFITATAAHCSASVADTIRTYTIDGVHIKNFTGKELAGKTIKSYEVHHAKVTDNSVIESHLIETTTPPAKKQPKPHYILDGKEIEEKELNSIPSSNIDHIEVLKAGSKAALQYGKDGDGRAYVIIKTKK